MISYTTEIDFKKKEVRTTFLKEVNTFCFDAEKFPLEDALKVASENIVNQLKKFLTDLIDHAENFEERANARSAEILTHLGYTFKRGCWSKSKP